MDAKTVIPRRSLHGELVDVIRNMLLEGELLAGAKIVEQELCERFGVSRTPLREALKVLASEGLVILSPNRGASVAKITPEEVEELFPIMGALEALAGELAAKKITVQALTRIKAMHNKMLGYYEKGDARRYAETNRQIHEAIFEAAGNANLTQFYQTLMVRTHAVRFVAKKSPKRWKEAIDDHIEIMNALERRDARRLADTLKRHLQHKADTVYETLGDAED